MGRERIAGTLSGLAVAAVAALASLVAPAHAAERAELALRFTERTPATPSGLELAVVYRHPDDAEAKPPAIAGLRIELPPGTAIDDGALPRCAATNEQLRLLGRDACPPASELGRGELTAATGFGAPVDPLRGDVTVFNGRGELIELVTFAGTNVTAGFDRIAIEGTTLTGHPPATPGGPPDGRTNVRSVSFALAAAGTTERPYLRTPPECPPDGAWTSHSTFDFADGGHATAIAQSPCARAGDVAAATGTARLSITPRRVRARERTRFRVRLATTPRSCARGARVRIGRARRRTGRSGRAVVSAALRRPGRVRVVAEKRGCRRASAVVRVLPARAR